MDKALRLAGVPTFVAMAHVHIGRLLRELYLSTGLKMSAFTEGVPYSPKTIYYHFGQEHLNTSILEAYEQGLATLGIPADVFGMIAAARRGEGTASYAQEQRPAQVAKEPDPEHLTQGQAMLRAAAMLRRTAAILEAAEPDTGPGTGTGQ